MFTIERRQRIRRLLLENKRVEVVELSRIFGLSESTIRRDLDVLEKEGFLHKTYGGAVIGNGARPSLEDADPLVEERDKIARVAAEMVSDNEAVFLGGGAPCLRLAGYLADKRRLTVATNDLEIALELADAPYISVKVTGGDLLPGTSTVVGPGAGEPLQGFCFNRTFISPAGADLRFGYAVASVGEARLLQTIISATRETVALLDRLPLGRVALAPVAGLAEIPAVVSTSKLPNEFKSFFLEHGVRLFTAYEIANPAPRRG